MMHFFVLGSNPLLSTAECLAIFGDRRYKVVAASRSVLVVDFDEPFDSAAAMLRLGGTIKVGDIIGTAPTLDPDALIEQFVADLENGRVADKRITFGMSAYGAKAKLERIGMEVKKRLKEAGIAARWVKPQQANALTSVVVEKNNLIGEGAEFVVIAIESAVYIGKTTAVQPFEEFSEADYGRPGRDTLQGMLPPKVARIMVNLARLPANAAVLDPFCGSGTILTEAARLGVARLQGSDLNPVAITNTEKNIVWLREKKLLPDEAAFAMHVADARDAAKHVRPTSLDAVITEPFLGPPRKGREKRGDLQRQLFELGKLYYQALSAWKKLLKPGAAIIMALPVYVVGEEQHGIVGKEFEKLGYGFEPLVPQQYVLKGTVLTKHGGIIYGRSGQHVYREIVKLTIKESGKE